jgi:hypothetical protein
VVGFWNQYAVARVRVGPERVSDAVAWRAPGPRGWLGDAHRARCEDRRVHARARPEVVPRSDHLAAVHAPRAERGVPRRSLRGVLADRVDGPIARVQAGGGHVRLPIPGLRPRLHNASGGTRRVRPAPGRGGPARSGQAEPRVRNGLRHGDRSRRWSTGGPRQIGSLGLVVRFRVPSDAPCDVGPIGRSTAQS